VGAGCVLPKWLRIKSKENVRNVRNVRDNLRLTRLDMGLVMRMLLTFAAVSSATFLLSER
jgi:hypothetical protein